MAPCSCSNCGGQSEVRGSQADGPRFAVICTPPTCSEPRFPVCPSTGKRLTRDGTCPHEASTWRVRGWLLLSSCRAMRRGHTHRLLTASLQFSSAKCWGRWSVRPRAAEPQGSSGQDRRPRSPAGLGGSVQCGQPSGCKLNRKASPTADVLRPRVLRTAVKAGGWTQGG